MAPSNVTVYGLVNSVLSKFKKGKLEQEAEATEYSGT